MTPEDYEYKVGDIVIMLKSFLKEPAGVRAYCYEQYNLGTSRPGISLITEHGVDLGGFSWNEQRLYLRFICKSNFIYKFHSSAKLIEDFKIGEAGLKAFGK